MNVFVFLIVFFALSYSAEKLFAIKTISPGHRHINRTRYIFLLFLVFFVALYSVRDLHHCSNDTQVYIRSFLQLGRLNYALDYHPNFEHGYLVLIYYISRLTLNPRVFLLLVGIFIYASFLFFIIRTTIKLSSNSLSSKKIIIAIVMFVICGTFFSSTNLQRQFIAIAIILLSYDYLYEKKFLRFYLLVFLAYQFHHSSLICCVLPLLHYIKINKRNIFIYVAVVALVLLFSTKIVVWVIKHVSYFREYSGYANSVSIFVSTNGVKIGPLCLFLIYSMFIVTLYYSLNLKDKYQEFLFKLFCCGAVFLASSIHFTLTDRMGSYFMPVLFPLFAIIPKKIPFYVCFVVQLVFCLIVNTFRQDWTLFFPYRFM